MTQPSMEQSPIVFQILLQMFSGIINRMQKDQIDYLISENKVLHDHLKKELNGRRLLLTINEKRILATLGKIIGRKKLKEIGTLFSPDTILRWYREIVGRKYDSSRSCRKLGRPRKSEEIENQVITIAVENPSYGYKRIAGAMANLGYILDKITVKNILERNGIDPAPSRKEGKGSWTFVHKNPYGRHRRNRLFYSSCSNLDWDSNILCAIRY